MEFLGCAFFSLEVFTKCLLYVCFDQEKKILRYLFREVLREKKKLADVPSKLPATHPFLNYD